MVAVVAEWSWFRSRIRHGEVSGLKPDASENPPYRETNKRQIFRGPIPPFGLGEGLGNTVPTPLSSSSIDCGSKGCGSPVVKASNHGRHVMRSIPVPLKTRRVGQRCTLNLSRAETSSRWCGVVVREGVPAQVSSTSLDHGSKLRGPSPKALV
ncbi:uncharacterized protein TNCV_1111261 [Trichonephila clavipes]|nr:uncharacterized protein TNCV_1111261 [Trichonephila clavipes]